jgi:hypothetical protein
MNLSRLRRRAALGYWIEALVRAVAPAIGILTAYLVAALFGFANPWASAAALLLAAAAALYGMEQLRRPGRQAIDRRIERASGLRHRPIAMLEDAPENDDPLAVAIWQIHQRRIAASLANARPGLPFIDAAARDPMAVRGLLLLLLLAGGIVAGGQMLPRIAGAFAVPAWPFAGPAVTAWATPPAYTGSPPSMLDPGHTYALLARSIVTVVVDGERHPQVTLGGKPLSGDTLGRNGFRAGAVLTAAATLRVGPWWHRLAIWNFNVTRPDAPEITLGNPFVVNRLLILSWHASDRYGLDRVTATLTPVGRPQATPQAIALAIGPDPHRASDVAKLDMGDSVYAGLPVSVVLTARNLAAMQTATTPVTVMLPPPMLRDKTALAIAASRQNLALNPAGRQPAGAALSKLAQHPLSRITGSADVQIAALAQALRGNEISAAAAQQLLDNLSHEVESGPDYQPARALAAAAQALEQALQQAANGQPLASGRLQKLLAAMQNALSQHLQALGAKTSAPASGSINPGDLNQMAEQIAQDEAAGHTAAAQAELRQLEQILAGLQSAKPMTAADAARSAAANQAQQALAKMTQAESRLLDQTNQGAASPATQAGLRNQLSATRSNLSHAQIQLPGLGDAATAMQVAQAALVQQNEENAAAAESGAIKGLQKAAAALDATDRGFSFDAGQSGAGAGLFENGTSGAPDESKIPAILPSAGNPAGAIQQQIIKNDSNLSLPAAVHQYYQRLLNQDAP